MRHPITQHSVVGKVVPLKDLQEAWMLRQLEQEVTILSRLNHDNVIRYIATFQAPAPAICVLMEYAPGGDLAKVIRTAQRDLASARQVRLNPNPNPDPNPNPHPNPNPNPNPPHGRCASGRWASAARVRRTKGR